MSRDPVKPGPVTGRRGGHDGPRGPAWWVGLVVGGLVLAYGVGGLLVNAVYTIPTGWAVWLIAALLAHDLVVIPAVLVVGRVAGWLPGGVRAPVRSALAVSGVIVVVTLPAFLGDGRDTQPGNTSLMPSDYGRGLVLVLGLVWAIAAVWALARSIRSRHRPARD